MPSPSLVNCPHEIRPGTTVCLHCRREARENRRARLRRTAGRLGLVGGAIAICAAAGSAGVNAFQHRRPALMPPPAAAAPALTPAPASAPATTPPLAPIIAEGRSPLAGNGIYAVRSGSVVTVHFDTPLTRTRRREKFELTLRSTLPAVYGPAADSMLANIPKWELVRGGSLLTELPIRGLRFPLAGGETLTIWPETKPGEDGPLVVAYRATVTQ